MPAKTSAERQRERRARARDAGLVSLTGWIEPKVSRQLRRYMSKNQLTLSAALAQLMQKAKP